MAKRQARRQSAALHKFKADPERVQPLFAEWFGNLAGDGGELLECFGYCDARGTIRRATGRYSNGWKVRINFNAKGQYTCHSCSLQLSAKPVRGRA